jgi:Short C-terminal domain
MGFIRKVLFVATMGLSGFVFKDEAKKAPVAKSAQKRSRTGTRAVRPSAASARVSSSKVATASSARKASGSRARQAPRSSAKGHTSKRQASRRPATRTIAPTPKPRSVRAKTAAKQARPANGTTSELERLAKLHAGGALSSEEFAAAKARILGTGPGASPGETGTAAATPPERPVFSRPTTPPPASSTPSRPPGTFQAVEANVAAARHLPDLGGHEGDRGVPVPTGGED